MSVKISKIRELSERHWNNKSNKQSGWAIKERLLSLWKKQSKAFRAVALNASKLCSEKCLV